MCIRDRLLTVLQDRVVERVGGTKPIFINVRVIAATNRNLERMVKEQKFRQDLFYRLNVVTLNIPPLRDRNEDIPPLVDTLVKKINDKLGTSIKKVSNKVIELMQNYSCLLYTSGPIYKSQVGAVVGAHSGPGAIGIGIAE